MTQLAPIYLIEDDPAVRASLSILLELEGFEVNGYGAAEAFLHDLPGDDYGCVVTDMHMPGLTGLELLRRLRAEHRSLPVLLITGRAHEGLGVQAMDAGATRLIEKPFRPEELIEAVRCALQPGA